MAGVAAAFALGFLPAMAADPAGGRAPLVAAAPVFSWTGFYVGAHAGGAAFETDVADLDGYGSGPTSISGNGGLIGVTAGFNWQAGQGVFGIEGDASWTDME